jgi:hypothetical protein
MPQFDPMQDYGGRAVVSEDDDVAHVSTPEYGVLPVAKQFLQPEQQQALQALPRAGAPAAAAESAEPMAPETQQALAEDAQWAQQQAEMQEYGVVPGAASAEAMQQIGVPLPTPTPAPQAAPAGVKKLSLEDTVGFEPSPVQQVGYQPAVDTMPSPMEQAFQAQEQGITGAAAAAGQLGAGTRSAMDTYKRGIQAAERDYQKRHAALEGENEEIAKSVREGAVKPGQYWENLGTGNKILAAISIGLGGFAAGMTGGRNVALDIIQKTIDNDIEAQKKNLDSKENLLARNLAKYKDLDTALAVTKGNLLALANATVESQKAMAMDSQAKNNAEVLKSNLNLQRQQLQQQSALRQAKMAITSGEVEGYINPEFLGKEAPLAVELDIGGRRVTKLAQSIDAAGKVRESEAASKHLNSLVGRMRDFMKGGSAVLPLTERKEEAGALRAETQMALKEFERLGVLNPHDVEAMAPLLPDPGALMQGLQAVRLRELEKTLDNKVEAFRSAMLRGYKPQRPTFQKAGFTPE